MLNEEIVEVVEAGKYTVNLYLDAGYELLTVQGASRPILQNRSQPDGQIILQRHVAYVMARKAGTPHFDPPARAERMKKAQADEGAAS